MFGLWDGTVSVIGFIFGLLLHHSSLSAIAIGGLGGAISASVSMGTGEYEKSDEHWRVRLVTALTMTGATLVGSMIPVIPFFLFQRNPALVVSALGCFALASYIGWLKHRGLVGFIRVYVTLLLAVSLTLGIVALIPQS